jgi:hypothetical protein
MLSSIFLRHKELDAKWQWDASRTNYYKRVLPIVTLILLALAIAIEVIYDTA